MARGNPESDCKPRLLAAGARGNLCVRTLSACVLAPVAVGAAYFGGWLFAAFWCLAAIGVCWEWNQIVADRARRVIFTAGTLVLLLAGAAIGNGRWALSGVVILVGALAAAAISLRGHWGWSALGLLYAAAVMAAPVILRADAGYGFVAMIFLFAIVWATDICAYFVGRLIGGPRLTPLISPQKTWSGAVGGAAGAVIAGTGVAYFGGLTNVIAASVLALLLSVVSQAGDLFESAIKRRFGVKDASHVIPGHGGIMDRVDGFVAAAVVAALIGLMRGGPDTPAQGLLIW